MDFIKALVPGSILTFVICAVMGAGHSKGGWLNIQHYYVQSHGFYWSWVLFAIMTGLAWMLYVITPK